MSCRTDNGAGTRRGGWGFVLIAFLVANGGCDQGGDGANRDETTDPDGSTDGVEPDVFTSATPRGKELFVNETNTNCWKNPDCKSCHDTVHTGGFRNGGECAYCHGSGGATPRSTGHDDGKCTDSGCHDANIPHGFADFDSPNDCRGCHSYADGSKEPCTHEESYDVIVVGAGGGGLAAAAQLAVSGLKVLVVEQSYHTGGAMTNFIRGEYRFEASLHATDGLTMGMVLSQLGISDKIVLADSEIMYHVQTPDGDLNIPADADAYRALLQETFPGEADDLDALFGALAAAQSSMDFSPFYDMTVSEMLLSFGIEDEALTAVFVALCSFLAGGPDELPAGLFVGMWTAYHFSGYLFPEGGSQAITTAITEKIIENFGVIKLHSTVDEIVVEDGLATGVRTSQGGCYSAPYIISNASVPDTYTKLVTPGALPETAVQAVEAREAAPSNTMLYLGVAHDYTEYFPQNSHEWFIFLDYGVEAFNMESDVCEPEKQGLSITNYTALDPTAAPAGKNVIVVASIVGYDCYNQWSWNDSYADYKALKLRFAETYLSRLEDYLPGISQYIEVMEVATPQTIEAYIKSPRGAWEGFDDIPVEQGNNPITFLAQENHKTPIPNLFLTGQWAAEGAQSVVLNSGVIAANLVLSEMQ